MLDPKTNFDQNQLKFQKFTSIATTDAMPRISFDQGNNAALSIIDSETKIDFNPANLTGIRHKNSLDRKTTFDYEIKTNTDKDLPNVDTQILYEEIEEINSPEILPENWNDLPEQIKEEYRHGHDPQLRQSKQDFD